MASAEAPRPEQGREVRVPSPRPLPRAHDQGRCGRPPVYAACTLPRAAFGERGRLQTLPGDAAQAPQPHPVRARAGLTSAPAAGGCPEPRFTAHPPCDGAPALVGSGQEASRRTGCLPWDPWSQDHARLSCLLSSLEFLCQGILKPPPGQRAGQSSSGGRGGCVRPELWRPEAHCPRPCVTTGDQMALPHSDSLTDVLTATVRPRTLGA